MKGWQKALIGLGGAAVGAAIPWAAGSIGDLFSGSAASGLDNIFVDPSTGALVNLGADEIGTMGLDNMSGFGFDPIGAQFDLPGYDAPIGSSMSGFDPIGAQFDLPGYDAPIGSSASGGLGSSFWGQLGTSALKGLQGLLKSDALEGHSARPLTLSTATALGNTALGNTAQGNTALGTDHQLVAGQGQAPALATLDRTPFSFTPITYAPPPPVASIMITPPPPAMTGLQRLMQERR